MHPDEPQRAEPNGSGQTSDRNLLAAIEATWRSRRIGRSKAFPSSSPTENSAELSAFKRFRRGILKPSSAEGGRLVPERYASIKRVLNAKLALTAEEISQLDILYELYWAEHWRLDARRSPFQAVKSRPNHTKLIDVAQERYEQHGLSLSHMFDPDSVLVEIKKLTASLSKTKNGYDSAIDALWMANAYLGTDEGKAVMRHDHRVADALRALFMREIAWNALQSENLVEMDRAYSVLNQYMNTSEDPSIAIALNTIGSFKERITKSSHDYSHKVSFSQVALAYSARGMGERSAHIVIDSFVKDPMIEYFAANEMRLQNRGFSERTDILSGKTIEEAMKEAYLKAIDASTLENAIRVGSGLCRGYINNGKISQASAVFERMRKIGAAVSPASKAGLEQVEGMLLFAQGDIQRSFTHLRRAARNYEKAGAFQRAQDVYEDLQKYSIIAAQRRKRR